MITANSHHQHPSTNLRWLRYMPGGRQLQLALAEGDFVAIDLAVRRTFFELFASISFLFLMLESVLFFYDGRDALAWTLLAYAFVAAIGAVFLVRKDIVAWYGRLSVLSAYTLFCSGFIGVLIYGDTHYMVWAIMFIPISFYFEGMRGGLIWLLIFGGTVLGLYGLFLWFGGDPFANRTIREMLISFTAITVFFAIFEKIRSVYEAKVILLNMELEELAATDKLTDVPNRRKLEDDLQLRIRDALRHKTPLAIVLFDLDFFKIVNDEFGHEAGDVVLKTVAGVVKQGLRESDSFGRWGGEEFVAILPETTVDGAMQLAEHMRVVIEALHIDPGIRVTASFGVAVYKFDEDADSVMRRVDAAMYAAKQQGRNRVVVATE